MRRIVLIAGTRPEAVKLAPVFFALRASRTVQPVLWSTGQHDELLRQVWQTFGLHPEEEMRVMVHAQSLAGLSARLFDALDERMERSRPDFLLVQGDTTTAMVAATCAFYRNIPVGHVEAGLRSHDLAKPFPEEFNRRVVRLAATLHFAPTPGSAQNLLSEGVAEDRIVITGNTVVDALLRMRGQLRHAPPELPQGLIEPVQAQRPLVLVTVHRRELSADGVASICGAIEGMASDYPDVAFVWPVHPNPRVKDIVMNKLSGIPNILLTPPLNYALFVYLLDRCHFVISDSGGIQEEASSLGKRILVVREVTERPEAVEAGFATLAGSDASAIRATAEPLLQAATPPCVGASNPFGDGHAAERIAARIERFFLTSEYNGKGECLATV